MHTIFQSGHTQTVRASAGAHLDDKCPQSSQNGGVRLLVVAQSREEAIVANVDETSCPHALVHRGHPSVISTPSSTSGQSVAVSTMGAISPARPHIVSRAGSLGSPSLPRTTWQLCPIGRLGTVEGGVFRSRIRRGTLVTLWGLELFTSDGPIT